MKFSVDASDVGVAIDILSRKVNETNENAVARWGISAARELAVKTQVRGKSGAKGKGNSGTKAKNKQNAAIESELKKAALVTENNRILKDLRKGKTVRIRVGGVWQDIPPSRLAKDGRALNSFVKKHRNARGKVGRITLSRRMICSKSTFNNAKKYRQKGTGMAKGGWLGAGIAIGRTQKGLDRATIGKNFLGYAQKHASKGQGRMVRGGNPVAILKNNAHHSGAEYVLSSSAIGTAVKFSAAGVLKYYEKALRAIERKAR